MLMEERPPDDFYYYIFNVKQVHIDYLRLDVYCDFIMLSNQGHWPEAWFYEIPCSEIYKPRRIVKLRLGGTPGIYSRHRRNLCGGVYPLGLPSKELIVTPQLITKPLDILQKEKELTDQEAWEIVNRYKSPATLSPCDIKP
jgi:hypothetical protein